MIVKQGLLRLLGIAAIALFAASALQAAPHDPPRPDVRLAGPARIMFDPAQNGCDGNDVPDAPARAFRRADGAVVLFGLHYTNHPLVGPSLDDLRRLPQHQMKSNVHGRTCHQLCDILFRVGL